jgi:hypothetical protein
VKKAADAAWNVMEKIKNAPANAWHALTPWSAPPAAGGAYYGASGPSRSGAGGSATGSGSPQIVVNIAGDVGDPVVLGRRVVAALDAYTSANGRRRLSELVNGSTPAVVRA